jgi:hypothetical protein
MLLAQFSAANSKLIVENERLRTGRQALAEDHADVLDEIEHLRVRLSALEGAAASTELRCGHKGENNAEGPVLEMTIARDR